MNTRTVSLRSLFVVCILLLLAFLYVFERSRADQLQSRLNDMTAPIKEEIAKQQFNIQKRELAYQYALDALPPVLSDGLNRGEGLSSNSFPIRARRELANLRNAKLKIDREKNRLKVLQDELLRIQGSD